jgi:two-component system, OmpR family, KDP operon response regulator KdpE
VREWSQTPIIILSVREAEQDKIAALDAGADDYLTKPFGTGELLARMRVALRKQPSVTNEPIFQSNNLSVDFSRRRASVNEKEVQLTPTEYDLLKVLVTHAGKVITHRQLLKLVWAEATTTCTSCGLTSTTCGGRSSPIHPDRRISILNLGWGIG